MLDVAESVTGAPHLTRRDYTKSPARQRRWGPPWALSVILYDVGCRLGAKHWQREGAAEVFQTHHGIAVQALLVARLASSRPSCLSSELLSLYTVDPSLRVSGPCANLGGWSAPQ